MITLQNNHKHVWLLGLELYSIVLMSVLRYRVSAVNFRAVMVVLQCFLLLNKVTTLAEHVSLPVRSVEEVSGKYGQSLVLSMGLTWDETTPVTRWLYIKK